MARMIPEHGPHETDSAGERDLYTAFKKHLPDSYTVIHSLPWLCKAVRQIDPSAKPTGEIDFLIIHPENGVLALEVKSGAYHVQNSVFVHIKDKHIINPITQTRKNVHGLAAWLGVKPSLRLRLGYGLVFPHSDFCSSPIAPGLYDTTATPPQPIYIDYSQMPNVAERVIELMKYWRAALQNPALGTEKMRELVNALCPVIDGTPSWSSRILYDGKVWLKLTTEQSTVVNLIVKKAKSLVTGWPGTGKTLIATEAARKLSADGKRVLVISFNSRLKDHIKSQLSDYSGCAVFTWHGLCAQATRLLERTADQSEWFQGLCLTHLQEALDKGLMGEYDALILDEAQALNKKWCELLFKWFENKTIACFCDETQVFSFERDTVCLDELSTLLQIKPFVLSIVIRMPKAVTEILAEVVPPSFQYHSPREVEVDSALEIMTIDPHQELKSIRSQLIEGGVKSDDIIILIDSIQGNKHYDYLVSEKIPFEAIAKFRGLECPIVIVLGAEGLGTAELFSAYSRATTKCIALYNVKNLYWDSEGGFQLRLENNPTSKNIITMERSKLRIRNIVECNTSVIKLSTKSIDISWAEEWRAWIVELETNETPVMLWLDYLSKMVCNPVIYWIKNTLNQVYYIKMESLDSEESGLHLQVELKNCPVCCRITPHKGLRHNKCVFCSLDRAHNHELPDSALMREIEQYDKLITGQITDKVKSLELRNGLPIAIAAAASLLYASRNKRREKILEVPLPQGKDMYRVAFAFAQSRIATWPREGRMAVHDIAEEIYNRYESLSNITLKSWQSIFANAMGTLYAKHYTIRLYKGVYCPVEDENAPNATSTARQRADITITTPAEE
ncbi:nuclease-related domain-containing DEAD/DEAH box helicase [Pseudomonas citri]|uniref:nuclease-related domain-containing DEAD/DEAH box helicase n=1 Tax=Pseudomonas citri TaxID=2978349 RepID=UPI0021B514CC|nr:NERD domain-containing protein [Pseudomonas citri]